MLSLLLALSAFSSTDAPSLCSIVTLRHNPEGYFWPLPDIRAFADSADVIIRARAVRLTPREVPPSLFSYPNTQVHFEVLEILKGNSVPKEVAIAGAFVDRDDFNRSVEPYRLVRAAGRHGDCFATEYRPNAEYLLLLRRNAGVLTPYWAPLAPLNEQIQGPDDPWVRWIRTEIQSY
jgi:hypothetical protein